MLVVIDDKAYTMDYEQADKLAEAVAGSSKGIYAVEKGGVMMLVNAPYSAERVLEYEANGYRVRYRIR